MNFRKITSLLVTAAIVLSVFAVPVSAEGQFTKYYLNDNFLTGADGWEVGQSYTGFEASTALVDDAGATDGKALKLTLPGQNKAVEMSSNYGNVTKAVNAGLKFETGREFTLETRVKINTPIDFSVYINRPDEVVQIGNDYNGIRRHYLLYEYTFADNYPGIMIINGSSSNTDDLTFNNNHRWATSSTNSGGNIDRNIVGKWVTYKVVFKPSEGNYYLTMSYTKEDGTEQIVAADKSGLMRATQSSIKKLYGADRFKTSVGTTTYDPANFYEALDRITLISKTGGDVYLDYVKVYESKDFINASVSLPNGTYIRASDSIDIKFTSDSEIESLPEDAFEITGVETDYTYNKETKTVTLTPKAPLAPGGIYFVEIDGNKLAEEEGMILSGDTSYTVEVTDVNLNNIKATGRIIPGTVITSSYEFASSRPEGTHIYNWQMSATGEDGTFTDIPGATQPDFTVTENEYGKYLRFRITPYAKDNDGNSTISGFESYSTVVIPEKKPVADNVVLSTTMLFPNSYIGVTYDYSDANGDAEDGTEITWYTADSPEGEWNLVYTGEIYKTSVADMGKYVKCAVEPRNTAVCEGRGVKSESAVAGPVADILEATNMLVNHDFESGDLTGWEWRTPSNGSWEGVSIQNHDTYNGSGYALLMPPRTVVEDRWGQRVAIEANKTYLQGAWAKLSNNRLPATSGFWPYVWDTTTHGEAQNLYDYTLTNRWQLVVGSFISSVARENTLVGPLSFETMTELTAHIDDMYFGELIVGDITTYDSDPIVIPERGTTSVTVTTGVPLNQLGTQHGLWNEKAYVRIPEGTRGVTVNGNSVVISHEAVAGPLNVEVYCEPTFLGATQSIFRKYVTLELVPGNDTMPKALDVTASGTVATGNTLTGSYTFYQVNGKADASEVRWMYSDSENGVYYDIPGATGRTYIVDAAYADKYIKFVVLPKTADGDIGADVYSHFLTKARVPVAKDLKITGDFIVGGTVKGEYTHYDPNGDAKGVSVYEWYISDNMSGNYTLIDGATSEELILTESMVDKYIKFKVTPVSVAAPFNGETAESDAIIGPATPQALNVAITQDGLRLSSSYFYYHPHNIEEGKTIYKWTADGVVLSQEADCPINFSGTKTVTLTITPVSVGLPSNGKSVSVSVTVTGTAGAVTGGPVGGLVVGGGSGGSFGGGGGAGGGGGGASSGTGIGVGSINDMNLTDPNAETESKDETKPENSQEETQPKTDLSGHWGEAYVNEMIDRGVMSADNNGNCKPDEFIVREEMLTYLFKALNLEATDYKNEFSDVSDGEFAKMLQTMVDNGTISKDTTFRPGDTISREEMCKILCISLENAGKLKAIDKNLIEGFADYNRISDWAISYVNAIYGNKIMMGVSATEFDPSGTVTRAQVATMLVRVLNLIENGEVPQINSTEITVYVDAKNGNDESGTGDAVSPVATIEKALSVATEKYNADTEGVYKNTIIIVSDGVYSSLNGINVKAKYPEGGLVIKAADGAKPVIDGGYKFSISEATQVQDNKILRRLPEGVDKTKIYALDLTTQMASIPGVSYPGSFFLNSELKKFGIEEPEKATCEATIDGNLMTVARYPNNEYAYTGHVLNEGVAEGIAITKDNIESGFTFESDYENLDNWDTADQALIFGYFKHDWATQTVPLKAVGSDTITSKYPSMFGIKEGARYYVYNLLEEMDMPGEYFIDRNKDSATYGTMFFYLPEDVNENSEISISNNNSALMTLNGKNVTIDGFTFTNARKHGVVFSSASSDCVVKNCTVKNTSLEGVSIGGTNNLITNCSIYDVNGGMVISGGDVPTLTRANNKATYNTIKRFSRLNKTYTDAIYMMGVGNTASHNVISDAEHLALRFLGSYHEVSYNDISNVLQECDDMGAIYVGRKWTDRGNKVLSNYIHDIGSSISSSNSVSGIFLDDHYAGAYIEGNVFVNIDGHGIRGNQGREHTITNNLFVNCTRGGVSIKDATGKADDYKTQQAGIDTLFASIEAAGTTEKWEKEFPELMSIANNMPYNAWGHTLTKNVMVNCGEAPGYTYGAEATQYAKSINENYNMTKDSKYYDSVLNGNYELTAEMVGIKGFKTIDFANMKK